MFKVQEKIASRVSYFRVPVRRRRRIQSQPEQTDGRINLLDMRQTHRVELVLARLCGGAQLMRNRIFSGGHVAFVGRRIRYSSQEAVVVQLVYKSSPQQRTEKTEALSVSIPRQSLGAVIPHVG
jgi:hypothetical protein